jgi:hypothetical protein
MYTLIDTFNKQIVSRHRTLSGAVTAEFKMHSTIKRLHGNNSYITMRILDNGKRLSEDQIEEAYGRYSN